MSDSQSTLEAYPQYPEEDEACLLGDGTINSDYQKGGKRKCYAPQRYLLALLMFWGFAFGVNVRYSFNISLLSMVNFTAEEDYNVSDSCPDDTPFNSSSRDKPGQYNWDPEMQGLLLGAFFYGYVVTQIPFALLAERFGSKWVFGFCGAVPCAVHMLCPILAQWHPAALVAGRIAMGLAQGGLWPASMAMWGRWAPETERSTLLALSLAGNDFGLIASQVITGYLCESNFLGGWPSSFYIYGALGCVWFLFWAAFASNSPHENRWIHLEEKEYISQTVGSSNNQNSWPPPIKSMLKSAPFWAIVFMFWGDGLFIYVTSSCMPLYLKQVLKIRVEEVGVIFSRTYAFMMGFHVVAGFIGDAMIRKGLSTTFTRKLLSVISATIVVSVLIAGSYIGCDKTLGGWMLTAAVGPLGIAGSGYSIVPLDLAPKYSGTIYALANTFDNTGGFLAPALTEFITHGQPSRRSWRTVFFVSSGVYLGVLLVYLIFGSSKLQPWAKDKETTEVDTDVQENESDVPLIS